MCTTHGSMCRAPSTVGRGYEVHFIIQCTNGTRAWCTLCFFLIDIGSSNIFSCASNVGIQFFFGMFPARLLVRIRCDEESRTISRTTKIVDIYIYDISFPAMLEMKMKWIIVGLPLSLGWPQFTHGYFIFSVWPHALSVGNWTFQ